MGRFYKTAKPTFVDDVIYQAPHELMLNALKTQDANFDNQQKELDAFDTMGDLLDFTDKDRGARNERLDLHRNKANELAEKIQQNPALYQQYIGEINRAKKSFNEDIKSGQLFEMDRTAKRRNKLMKEIKGNKTISEEARNQALLTIDREYQGVGKGDFAEDIHIYDKVDETKFQKDLKATINVDTEGVSTTRPNGAGYLITSGETKTYLTEDRLKEIIDSDPVVADWKREQLQTLGRQLDNGGFDTKEDPKSAMEKVYTDRLEEFKENTIAKLEYKKINSVNGVSSDSTFNQKANRAQSAWQFNQRRLDKVGENFTTEISGVVETISDDEINTIYGEESQRVSGPSVDGVNFPTLDISPAQKRRLLDKEKGDLKSTLDANGLTMEDFRNKMKTSEGRTELRKMENGKGEQIWKDINKLSRQANYNKTFNYKTPVIENYNSGDATSVREQNKYINATVKNLNQFDVSTKTEIETIDGKGNKQKYNMSISEAYSDTSKGFRLLEGPQKQIMIDVPKTNIAGAFVDINGVPLEKIVDGEESFMTLAEAKASGRLAFKKEKSTSLDNSKPLLDVKKDEVFETKDYKYNGGHSVTEKDYFIVKKQALNEKGEPITVIFKIDKKNPSINKGINPEIQR